MGFEFPDFPKTNYDDLVSKIDNPNFKPPAYKDTIFADMAEDIKSSQSQANEKLNEMTASSKTDRKINIAILTLTSISTICSILALIIALR